MKFQYYIALYFIDDSIAPNKIYNYIITVKSLGVEIANSNEISVTSFKGFDIVIEDGLHTFNANVCFFENSIHKLKHDGFFIIEDIRISEISLFVNKIKDWEAQHKDCLFTLLKIPSICNNIDNITPPSLSLTGFLL